MGEVFRSGAFLQQCWSVHPLCLGVKRITAEQQLAVACTSCRFAHYVTMGSIAVGVGAPSEEVASSMDSQPVRSEPRTLLANCLQSHARALSLREMDVFEDRVVIRCAECRRHYAVTVAAFETHQK